MPTPGITTLKTELAFPYTVEGGFDTSIVFDGSFNVFLATGMHNGWTCASPTTPSSMEVEIQNAFSGYVAASGPYGTGWEHLRCLGIGIDEEIDAWIASWNGSIHTYTVNAASIESRIVSCFPWSSNATNALAARVAQAFDTYFIQEVG